MPSDIRKKVRFHAFVGGESLIIKVLVKMSCVQIPRIRNIKIEKKNWVWAACIRLERGGSQQRTLTKLVGKSKWA